MATQKKYLDGSYSVTIQRGLLKHIQECKDPETLYEYYFGYFQYLRGANSEISCLPVFFDEDLFSGGSAAYSSSGGVGDTGIGDDVFNMYSVGRVPTATLVGLSALFRAMRDMADTGMYFFLPTGVIHKIATKRSGVGEDMELSHGDNRYVIEMTPAKRWQQFIYDYNEERYYSVGKAGDVTKAFGGDGDIEGFIKGGGATTEQISALRGSYTMSYSERYPNIYLGNQPFFNDTAPLLKAYAYGCYTDILKNLSAVTSGLSHQYSPVLGNLFVRVEYTKCKQLLRLIKDTHSTLLYMSPESGGTSGKGKKKRASRRSLLKHFCLHNGLSGGVLFLSFFDTEANHYYDMSPKDIGRLRSELNNLGIALWVVNAPLSALGNPKVQAHINLLQEGLKEAEAAAAAGVSGEKDKEAEVSVLAARQRLDIAAKLRILPNELMPEYCVRQLPRYNSLNTEKA